VLRIQEGTIKSCTYFDWADHGAPSLGSVAEARRRFVEIACEYLHAVTGHGRPIGCALSGGTDSALVAFLLKFHLGYDVSCFTLHYRQRHYSEWAIAQANARRIGVAAAPVVVRGTAFRGAFRELNGLGQDRPCAQAQAALFLELARRARHEGMDALVTGDHADALFLGFEEFLQGLKLPGNHSLPGTFALDPEAQLSWLAPRPVVSAQDGQLLRALDLNPAEYRAWLEDHWLAERSYWEQFIGRVAWPVLQQLRGQVWAGIGWQHLFWPTEQMFARPLFVSPFYDVEMIKFALGLPVEAKFREGLTKVFLRDFLKEKTGIEVCKRSSPSPVRLWSLWPGIGRPGSAVPELGRLYKQVWLRNVACLGGLYGCLTKLNALGQWLESQRNH
jgi:asparagine synthetase B (glutamine-hydrolysing)